LRQETAGGLINFSGLYLNADANPRAYGWESMKASPGDDAVSLFPAEPPPKSDSKRLGVGVFGLLLQVESQLRAEVRDEQKDVQGRRSRAGDLSQDRK
jgi:hypothetical protein